MKLKWLYCGFFLIIPLFFLKYNLLLTASLTAVELWLKKVFPFLFIMLVFNDLLINLNFAQIFSSCTPFIWVMSLLSGAPSNAFIISNLYKTNQINKHNANIYLLFTYFANPLFLFTMLHNFFNLKTVIKLIIIHYLSNLIIYLINRKNIVYQEITSPSKTKFNLGQSIKKSMDTLIMILGTITFFMVMSSIISQTLHLNIIISTLLKGFLEVTQGLNALHAISLSNQIKEIMAIGFISFGGISIHSQVKCILVENNLDYRFFFQGRLYQTIISIILTALT